MAREKAAEELAVALEADEEEARHRSEKEERIFRLAYESSTGGCGKIIAAL